MSTGVQFVRRVEDIDRALWDQCFPAPREGWFWYQALERSGLEDQFAFHYAVIRRDGRDVGIAPCFLHDVPIALVAPAPVAWVLRGLARVFPRVGFQRTFFIGSPCSDEGTVGLVPGVTLAEIVVGLRAAVRAQARELGARMVVFKDFPAVDVAALEADGFVATVSYPGTVLDVSPPDKDAYFRRLSQNQRHNFRKKLRRSREVLALETRVVERPTDEELAAIFSLFLQTYERGKTKFERLGLRFFREMREHPEAKFILQRDAGDGRLAAFMLVFQLGDRVINKFIGLDYGRGDRGFLYFRLFDAALDFAYAVGAKELQSGQTGYRAKLDLGHRLVPLFNLFHHERFPVHWLFRTIGRRITWRSLDEDLARAPRPEPPTPAALATAPRRMHFLSPTADAPR